MAAKRHINLDKTEVILMFLDGNGYQSINLTYDQIIRIQFDRCFVKRFLWSAPSERIQIVTGKRLNPIEYFKNKELLHFEEYKKSLEKFAKYNKISFVDNT